MYGLETLARLNKTHEAKMQLIEDVECMETFLVSESDPQCLLEGVLDPVTRDAMRRILALTKGVL